MKDKATLLREFEYALRGAAVASQDSQLAILEAGEGRNSADFLFMERQESYLVDVLQRIEAYRAALPAAHSWFKAK